MSITIRYESEEKKQNARINGLDISARASMTLKGLGIMYISQLKDLSPEDLNRKIWLLDPEQKREVREALTIWKQQAYVQTNRKEP